MTDQQISRLIELFSLIINDSNGQLLELKVHGKVTAYFCYLGKRVLDSEKEVSRILWVEMVNRNDE